MKKAIVLLSGGMDSCTCLAIAKKEGEEVGALHLNYGQRTEKRELDAFHKICDFYGIEKRLIVDITHLTAIGGSSLTDKNIPVEAGDFSETSIPSTYVPFRNGNILAIAASWAEVLNFNQIYVGAVAEDSAGYPDCRPEFYEAYEEAINIGTKPETRIKIITPLINLNKSEIVQKGLELDAPLALTWSCYTNLDAACGKCDSCLRRLRGFSLAKTKDPINYVFGTEK